MVSCFIYFKVTTCFGPYSWPSSGHKMNSLRELHNVIYKINNNNNNYNNNLIYSLHCTVSSKNSFCDLLMTHNNGRNMSSP